MVIMIPCKLEGSSVASGLMLQKSNASPILGFTESPFLPHAESSLYHGTELKFILAAGNTVSPPSSTSDLYIELRVFPSCIREKEERQYLMNMAALKRIQLENHLTDT